MSFVLTFGREHGFFFASLFLDALQECSHQLIVLPTYLLFRILYRQYMYVSLVTFLASLDSTTLARKDLFDTVCKLGL